MDYPSNVSVIPLCVESSKTRINPPCVIVLRNQFLIRRIVEADLSLFVFVAGGTRDNLKNIIISEKNSLSIQGHCFMYLTIPGLVFYQIR